MPQEIGSHERKQNNTLQILTPKNFKFYKYMRYNEN